MISLRKYFLRISSGPKVLELYASGVLWTGGFGGWLLSLTRWKVAIDTLTHCKLFLIVFNFCQQYSSSLLVIMSLEKLFALYFPLRAKSICTVSTAKKLTLASAVMFFLWDGQLFFIVALKRTENGDKYCKTVNAPDSYVDIFYQIHSILYSFAPFTIMVIANCMIIFKFMMAKWQNRRGGTESVSQALSKSAVKGTVMLVTVSTAFIILTGPMAICLVVYGDNRIPFLVHGSVVLLQFLNHSINSVLYCITGSRFRHELIKIFGCSTQMRSSILSFATKTSSISTDPTSTAINSTCVLTNSTSMHDVASTGSPI